MTEHRTFIVIGSTGLIGSEICRQVREKGFEVLGIHSSNYEEYVGHCADVLVNCNGNTYRYRANQDPKWDFQASVESVQRSLLDFKVDLYVYLSTIDVYSNREDPACNHEAAEIQVGGLDVYGFHKWVAERLVEKYASRHLIFRCGTALGPALKKGPIYDLLNNQPLHMSLDSTLSLIDTDLIVKMLLTLVAADVKDQIVNVTGTSPACLRDLQEQAALPATFVEGAENVLYAYNINNEKFNTWMDVPESAEIGRTFIRKKLSESS